jgi:predicted P-loop ATPase
MERTAGKWIVEAGELKGMSKTDYHTLKSFLSRTVDEARMSYGRKTRIAPRQFVVIGTTNDEKYLSDPTGNRRWWPVQTPKFNLDTLRRDVGQLWAEACTIEANGESIRLAPELWPLAAIEQEARRLQDTFENELRDKLADLDGKLAVKDAWQLLGIVPIEASPQEQTRLGSVMTILGWKHARSMRDGKRTYCYVLAGTTSNDLMTLPWLVVAGGRVTT